MTSILTRTAGDVKTSAVAAAKIEAGHVAIEQLAKLVKKGFKPTSPASFMIAQQLDTQLGKSLLGVAAAQAIKELKGTDPRFVKMADAMTFAATQDLLRSFDVNGLLDKLIEGEAGAAAAGLAAE